MIGRYSLGELKKMFTSGVFLIGAIAAFVFSEYDPSVTDAFVALVGALFGVAGVFLAKNHTEDDLSKAVAQLQAAALTVVGYFATVQPGTVEKITVLSGAVVSVIAVYWVRNENPQYAEKPGAVRERVAERSVPA